MGKIQHILLTLLLVLSMPATALGQASNIVRGTVIDGDNEPIIGATVHEIDGTNRVHSMTSTDINGEFSLQVKNPANKLKFSYVGFTPQVLPIEPVMNVTLRLNPDGSYSLENRLPFPVRHSGLWSVDVPPPRLLLSFPKEGAFGALG